MTINTNGYGGRRVQESIHLETNDPDRSLIQLAVTGMVEKFAEITPERIRFAGASGTPMFAEVEIVPRKEYPFAIEKISAKSGEFIKYELIRSCASGRDRCIIRVENIRVEKGRYIDTLQVMTNSKLRPEIPIYVIGMIR